MIFHAMVDLDDVVENKCHMVQVKRSGEVRVKHLDLRDLSRSFICPSR